MIEFAQRLFPLIKDNNSALLYVDCNAVSPQTVQDIGTLAATNSVRLQDVGIIGLGPRPDRIPVRFYTSGPWLEDMQSVATPLIEIMPMGAEIGRASAIKMAYASLTKGTNALRTAALLLGEQLGVRAELSAELEYSQAAVFRAMEHIPLLAADAERWGGEMQQIAATYRDAGLTTGFHEAAQWVFELLAATPMAQETRATVDGERGLEETIRILADTLTTMR